VGRIEAKNRGSAEGRCAPPKKSELAKAGELCRKAIASFGHFVEMYREDTDRFSELSLAVDPDDIAKMTAGCDCLLQGRVEKDETGPYLRAHFYQARLLGRLNLTLPNTEDAVKALKRSFDKYTWLVPHAKALLDANGQRGEGVFDAELDHAEQLVQLLPDKLNQMHYKGTRFSDVA